MAKTVTIRLTLCYVVAQIKSQKFSFTLSTQNLSLHDILLRVYYCINPLAELKGDEMKNTDHILERLYYFDGKKYVLMKNHGFDEFMLFVKERANKEIPVYLAFQNDIIAEDDVNEKLLRQKLLLNDVFTIFNNLPEILKMSNNPHDIKPIFENLPATLKMRNNIQEMKHTIEKKCVEMVRGVPEKSGVLNIFSVPESQLWNLLKEEKNVLIPYNNSFLLLNFAQKPRSKACEAYFHEENNQYHCHEIKNINVTFVENNLFLENSTLANILNDFNVCNDGDDTKNVETTPVEWKVVSSKGLETESSNNADVKNELTESPSVNEKLISSELKTKPNDNDDDKNKCMNIPPVWFEEYIKQLRKDIVAEVKKEIKQETVVKSIINESADGVIPAEKLNYNMPDSYIIDSNGKKKDLFMPCKDNDSDNGCSIPRPLFLPFEDPNYLDTKNSKKRKLKGNYGSMLLKLEKYVHDNSNERKKLDLKSLNKYFKNLVCFTLNHDVSVVSVDGAHVKMTTGSWFSTNFILSVNKKYRADNFNIEIFRVPPEVHIFNLKRLTEINFSVNIHSTEFRGRFPVYFIVTYNGIQVGQPFEFYVFVKKHRARSNHALNRWTEIRGIYSAPTSGNDDKSKVSKSVENSSCTNNVDQADEGIGNQEDYYTPTDSDDTDAEERKSQVPKDEGIDTCYHSAIFNAISNDVNVDSDSDTNSSISLLLDEKEARNNIKYDLAYIQLPRCFRTNVNETSDEPVSIRWRRKAKPHDTSKEKTDSNAMNVSTSDVEASSSGPESAKLVTQSHVKSLDIDEDSESDVKKMSALTSFMDIERDHTYYRSIYPNLVGLKETVTPSTSATSTNKSDYPNVAGLKETVGSTDSISGNNTNKTKKTGNNKKSDVGQEPPIDILPEKVFETASNVFKNVFNAIKTPYSSNSKKNSTSQEVENLFAKTLNSVTRDVERTLNLVTRDVERTFNSVSREGLKLWESEMPRDGMKIVDETRSAAASNCKVPHRETKTQDIPVATSSKEQLGETKTEETVSTAAQKSPDSPKHDIFYCKDLSYAKKQIQEFSKMSEKKAEAETTASTVASAPSAADCLPQSSNTVPNVSNNNPDVTLLQSSSPPQELQSNVSSSNSSGDHSCEQEKPDVTFTKCKPLLQQSMFKRLEPQPHLNQQYAPVNHQTCFPNQQQHFYPQQQYVYPQQRFVHLGQPHTYPNFPPAPAASSHYYPNYFPTPAPTNVVRHPHPHPKPNNPNVESIDGFRNPYAPATHSALWIESNEGNDGTSGPYFMSSDQIKEKVNRVRTHFKAKNSHVMSPEQFENAKEPVCQKLEDSGTKHVAPDMAKNEAETTESVIETGYLKLLQDMGFLDQDLNKKLLVKYNNEIDRVVESLIARDA